MHLSIVLILSLCVGMLSSSANGADSTNEALRLEKSLKEKYSEVVKGLEKFEHSKDFDELDKITVIIESIWDGSRQDGVSWKNRRYMKLQSWLSSLNVIEKSIDKDFNKDDVPEVNIAPPSVEGVFFDSGIRPDVIKDPKIRAQYEEMLKQNEDKAEHYRFQHNIRRFEKEWCRKINSYIRNYYSDTNQDQKEISDIIDVCISDKERNMGMKKELLKKSSGDRPGVKER